MIFFKKCKISYRHDFSDVPCKKCNGIILDRDFWIKQYNKHHIWVGTLLVLIGLYILLKNTP